MEDVKFYIWSIDHYKWWRGNSMGYTNEKKDAGIYSYEEATRIVHDANIGDDDTPCECLVPVEDSNE